MASVQRGSFLGFQAIDERDSSRVSFDLEAGDVHLSFPNWLVPVIELDLKIYLRDVFCHTYHHHHHGTTLINSLQPTSWRSISG